MSHVALRFGCVSPCVRSRVVDGRALPDGPGSVCVWLDGERVEWSDAMRVPLPAPDSSRARWSLEMADQDMTMEIETSAPAREAISASGSRYRLSPVRATLSVGDERRSLGGIRIEDAGP